MSLKKSIATALTIAAISAVTATSALAQTSVKQGVTPLPARDMYGLTSDNSLYVLRAAATQWVRVGRFVGMNGDNSVGIDIRPGDGRLYVVTDRNRLLSAPLSSPLNMTPVSTLGVSFNAGFGSLADFNPVANALRLIGSNDQNLAVVNGADGSSLSTTVAQGALTYAAGDPAAGQNPEVVGGCYSNNFVGATSTLFYMFDHVRDTLVTPSTLTATGSSNTGVGAVKSLGNIVGPDGRRLNMAPGTDCDIYTDANGRNFLVGQTSRLLFSIDLSTVNINLPVGQTQNVVARRGPPGVQLANGSPSLSGGLIDIAIQPR